MNKTNQKIESLAIDAMTQFKSGVEKVRIGNRIVEAQSIFNISRISWFDELSDDERVIAALTTLIEFHYTSKEIRSSSVEVVA